MNRSRKRRDCAGLRVAWDAEADTSRVSLPSRCFRGGHYGAVRTFLLTDEPGGSDSDYAPDPRRRIVWTDWATRG